VSLSLLVISGGRGRDGKLREGTVGYKNSEKWHLFKKID